MKDTLGAQLTSTNRSRNFIWLLASRLVFAVEFRDGCSPQIPRITRIGARWKYTYDWSRDGRQLLVSQAAEGREPLEIWSLPTSEQVEPQARRIAGDPALNLYQPHFSADQRWIVFEALKERERQSVLFVIPANGGAWIPITASPHWDDKPRWSPDGSILYFLSEAHGFFNVWGLHFDGNHGRPIGKPFQVSKFETPDLMIPTYMPPVELSVAANRMVLNLTEAAGAIWILDDVGP